MTWEDIPLIDQNGVIITYEVLYEPLQTFRGNIAEQRANTTNSSITLMDLEEFVNYSISVRGYTIVGPGIYSVAVTVMTQEDSKLSTSYIVIISEYKYRCFIQLQPLLPSMCNLRCSPPPPSMSLGRKSLQLGEMAISLHTKSCMNLWRHLVEPLDLRWSIQQISTLYLLDWKSMLTITSQSEPTPEWDLGLTVKKSQIKPSKTVSILALEYSNIIMILVTKDVPRYIRVFQSNHFNYLYSSCQSS